MSWAQDTRYGPPPQDWAIKQLERGHKGFDKLRSEAKRLILKYGQCSGGVLIFHPYRALPKTKADFKTARENGFEGKLWDWIRHQGSWETLVYVSPHFHFIGVGYFEQSDILFESTGWIYQTKQRIKGTGDNLLNNVVAVARYALSHAGAKFISDFGPDLEYYSSREDTKVIGTAYTWIGILSNRVAKLETEDIEVTAQCTCARQGTLYRYSVEDPDSFSWNNIIADRDHECWYEMMVQETEYHIIVKERLIHDPGD